VRIEILYFAAAREAAGRPSEPLEVREGETVRGLRGVLGTRHPGLVRTLAASRLAVGEAFAAEDRRLEPGDVVAVLPPVSGG
jgi:molybdopterin synthase sulfur carrier subunit